MVATTHGHGGGKGAPSTLFSATGNPSSPAPWIAPSPPPKDAPTRPSIVIDAAILVAMHDFEARSPDELTLRKGEQIEIIERDGR